MQLDESCGINPSQNQHAAQTMSNNALESLEFMKARLPTEHSHGQILVDGNMFTVNMIATSEWHACDDHLDERYVAFDTVLATSVSTTFWGMCPNVGLLPDAYYETRIAVNHNGQNFRYGTLDEAQNGHASYVKIAQLTYLVSKKWRLAKKVNKLDGSFNKEGRKLFATNPKTNANVEFKNLIEDSEMGHRGFF